MISRGCISQQSQGYTYNPIILRARLRASSNGKRGIWNSCVRKALATRAPPPPQSQNTQFNLFVQHGGGGGGPTFLTPSLSTFLPQNLQTYTILPTPTAAPSKDFLFPASSSSTSRQVFSPSPLHQVLAVIDACLANSYDVPRARALFNGLRTDKTLKGHPLMGDVRMYNSVLRGYLVKAYQMGDELEGIEGISEKEREMWLDEFWNLYEVLAQNAEVQPNASTFGLALVAHIRSTLPLPIQEDGGPKKSGRPRTRSLRNALPRSPNDIIRSILEHRIPMYEIIMDYSLNILDDPSFISPSQLESSEMVIEIPQEKVLGLLSRTAMEMGSVELVEELAAIEEQFPQHDHPSPTSSTSQSSQPHPHHASTKDMEIDPLIDVPEVRPVRKSSSLPPSSSSTNPKDEDEIPFNLALLRSRLAGSEKTRRLLMQHAPSSSSSSSSNISSIPLDFISSTPNSLQPPTSNTETETEIETEGDTRPPHITSTPHFRQIELENLTYHIASLRMKHETESLEKIGKAGEIGENLSFFHFFLQTIERKIANICYVQV